MYRENKSPVSTPHVLKVQQVRDQNRGTGAARVRERSLVLPIIAITEIPVVAFNWGLDKFSKSKDPAWRCVWLCVTCANLCI